MLKQQILQSAPADVFSSADQSAMDNLKKQGFAVDDKIFARNRLVLAVRKGGKVGSLPEISQRGIRVVVADGNVPVGRYTAQVLEKMSQEGVYGDDFQKRVHANTVSQETNVRNVLMKVILGEADAGFVYATDVVTSQEKVNVLPIPDRVNIVAVYPIAVLIHSDAPVS